MSLEGKEAQISNDGQSDSERSDERRQKPVSVAGQDHVV